MSAKKTSKPDAEKKTPNTDKAVKKTIKQKAGGKAKKPSAPLAETQGKGSVQPALTKAALSPPAKAEAISPAVQEAKTLAVKEEAQTPAVKVQAAPPAVKQEAQTPAVKVQAAPPAVKEEAQTPAVKVQAAPPAVKEEAKVPAVQTEAKPATMAQRSASTPSATTATSLRNPYLPYVATVMEVIDETHNIKSLRVVLDNAEAMRSFSYLPGQVGQLSVFGVGEATFVINSPPSQKQYLQFSIMRTGEVTEALHRLAPGDKVGVRAPLGNPFPYEDWKGKDIFFVGGGIGMAPLRTIMLHLLENKQDYGQINLLYGARSPRDMAYSYEMDGWLRHKGLNSTFTIDAPFEGWEHKVGLIPHVLLEMAPRPENTVAVLCGPPIMIKFTVEALKKLEFPDECIITTLERRMKCGIGICGRCNIGGKYVCLDGPVFSWAQLKALPPEL